MYVFGVLTRTLTQLDPACTEPQLTVYSYHNIPNTAQRIAEGTRLFGWVSLDRADNDALRFWSYVITALDTLVPGIGTTALALLQSPQPILSELTYSECRSLAPLLLDTAIAQKCRKHDYGAVNELLKAANRYGLANSPLCAQAAKLLERLAVCSHAIQASNRTRLGH